MGIFSKLFKARRVSPDGDSDPKKTVMSLPHPGPLDDNGNLVEYRIINQSAPDYWERESRLPFARYEAAYQLWGDRSWLPAAVQDSRFDFNSSVRLELIRRARYWEQNNGLAWKLGLLFAQFSVGPNGLRLIPNAGGDEDEAVPENDSADVWNKAASRWWTDWSQTPDLCSLRTLGELQHTLAIRWFFDGEIFIHKTFSTKLVNGRLAKVPRVELIESHRIGTPSSLSNEEGKTIFDGVQVDGNGTPIAYWVRKKDTGVFYGVNPAGSLPPFKSTGSIEQYDPIPAEEMIHVYEPSRPGMYRAPSFLFAVMNDLHDLDDLQFSEMKAAKAAADLAVIYITKSGEVKNAQSLRQQKMNIQTQDANGNAITQTNRVWYDVTQTGRDRYLKPGEDAKMFESNRPTVTSQSYWDYLTSKVCAGVGISKLLVLPYSNQGTVVRSDLDTNSVFFRSRSAVLARAIKDVYQWSLGWAKDFDRSMDGTAPDDWNRVIVRPPRSINVDVGRNSTAMLAELDAGTRNYSEIFAESGEDWKEQLEQKAKEAAFINELSTKYNVPREQIAAMAKAAVTSPTGSTFPAKTSTEQPQTETATA